MWIKTRNMILQLSLILTFQLLQFLTHIGMINIINQANKVPQEKRKILTSPVLSQHMIIGMIIEIEEKNFFLKYYRNIVILYVFVTNSIMLGGAIHLQSPFSIFSLPSSTALSRCHQMAMNYFGFSLSLVSLMSPLFYSLSPTCRSPSHPLCHSTYHSPSKSK